PDPQPEPDPETRRLYSPVPRTIAAPAACRWRADRRVDLAGSPGERGGATLAIGERIVESGGFRSSAQLRSFASRLRDEGCGSPVPDARPPWRSQGGGASTLLVMLSNRSALPGPVIPELAYPDVGAAVDWLVGVLGFTERVRIGPGHRAQLSFDEGSLIVADLGYGRVAPTGEGAAQSVTLRVDDVASLCDRVRQNG